MTYDPFARGPHPAGVTTTSFHDASRDRTLVVEIWYPATDGFRGKDAEPDLQDAFSPDGLSGEEGSLARQAAVRGAERLPGELPVVLLCHGFSGHRRESTFIGTHLASHGYLVASADFSGSTFPDIASVIATARAAGRRFERTDIMPQLIVDRKRDIPFLLDRVIAEHGGRADLAGITGASFGGWSSFMAPSADPRIRVIAPMCPSGGETPIYPPGKNHARNGLDFKWPGGVALLQMVADRDSWLPLYGQVELFQRATGPKRMIVLRRADHNHFVDDIAYGHEWLRDFTAGLTEVESAGGVDWAAIARNIAPYRELCPEDKAHECWRGLCVAHMDAYLKGNAEALALLEGDIPATLAARGIDAVQIRAAGA